MALSDYLAVLKRRWKLIAVVALLTAFAATAITFLMTPRYESRAQVFVSFQPTDPSSSSGLISGSTYTQNQITSYVDLATSPTVLDPAIETLGLATTAGALADDLVISNPQGTVLIDVVATSDSAAAAAEIANGVAASMTEVIPEFERPDDATSSPVKLTIVRVAVPPSAPSSPNVPLNIGLGVITGLLLAIGAAALRQSLDTKVRSEDDVRAITQAPVIGTIGYDDEAPSHPLIVQTSPRSARSEAFRRLRTNLQFIDIEGGTRAFVITSAAPGEGKSTTAINLAISLADAGSRVVLVDADLRRPSVADYMGLEKQVGLTTVLIGQASFEDVVQPWGNSRLHVITSGQLPPNPSELLGSHSMATLVKELTGTYDVVLLDTAPLLPVTDGAILARLSAGALVVAGADKVHRAQLAEALGRLSTVGARVLGIVINRISRAESEPYTYYDYTPGPTPPTKRELLGRRRGVEPPPRHAAVDPPGESVNADRPKSTWPGRPMSKR